MLLTGLAGSGFAVFAEAIGFFFGAAELGLAGAGFSWIGSLTAVLSKQSYEVHPSNIARGGTGQLQPIKVANRGPMRSVLMQFPARGQSSARISGGRRMAAANVNDERCMPRACRYRRQELLGE